MNFNTIFSSQNKISDVSKKFQVPSLIPINSQGVLKSLYVYPTYAVLLPKRERTGKSLTMRQIDNQKNLLKNKTNGGLSNKSRKRLVNAINWLVLASKKKRLFDAKLNQWLNFRISFITLTIPYTDKELSDYYLKNKILHSFLMRLKYSHNLTNYVWKIERTSKNMIHFHLTTDVYINYKELRAIWNNILLKNGLIDEYKIKYSKMSLDDYISSRLENERVSIMQLKKAYNEGCQSNWTNPNSTDVHSVKGIKDLSAYLSDYMGKKEEGKNGIKGRQWGASHSLLQNTKIELEVLADGRDVDRELFNYDGIKVKPIELEDKETGDKITFGYVYFWKLSEISLFIKSRVFLALYEIVDKLRGVEVAKLSTC